MSNEEKSKVQKPLTAFGKYLEVRSVNNSDVARKVGISITRLNRLRFDEKSYLRAYELQLTALAINVEPEKMQKDLFGHLELKEAFTPSEKLINSISKSLSEKGLIAKYCLTIKDLERASEILPFCIEEKTEADILALLSLKRKSSKLMMILKACIEADLLSMQQRNKDGLITTFYCTTETGKEVVAGV